MESAGSPALFCAQCFCSTRGALRARRYENIDRLLFALGVSPVNKGGRYMRLALRLTAEDARLLDNLEGRLYPAVAARCGDLPVNVERGIRYAIQVCWRRMPPDDRLRLAPRCGAKPGNKLFLTALHRRLCEAEDIFAE